ncbi:MAG TPA: carboxypeptidase regulatory-like domain-containing protein [Candidatus Acidoferrum sp.]|jgi:protocatechuate 3,4-dioxygenase beta subunit
MKLLLVALAALLFVPCAAAQSSRTPQPTPKADECSISGLVVALAGSIPLKRARIVLRNLDAQDSSLSSSSDANGHFELKGITPGRFRLSVLRTGYVTQQYGQRKPNDPGSILTLRPGQNLKDLLFRMLPSAVIAGRITDEDGEPVPAAQIFALREVYTQGRRELASETSVATNDLGEYRLFGLRPGHYFVSAELPRQNRFGVQQDSDDKDVFTKMYYPGTPDSDRATAIVVKSGEEIPSVEILMRRVLAYRIHGRVYNLVNQQPGTGANLFLVKKSASLESSFGQQVVPVEKTDGSFEINSVLPGSYVLAALWFNDGKSYSAQAPIEVGSSDIEGIQLTIVPGINISGRIAWDGPPSLQRDVLNVGALSVDTSFRQGGGFVTVSRANTFSLANISEGTYRAQVFGQSKDCYIKDVQYAGSSALQAGFSVVRGAISPLEITISSKGARLQGTVSDADGLPSPGVWVVLVPDAPRRSRYELYKYQSTDQYGHFDLHGIAPGDYKLFSWEEVENDAWQDPEFLQPFETKGEKISVQDNDQKTLSLTAIKSASTAQQKQ